ncbi:hypothetical protein SAMN04487830_14212 [Pseudobutyrivibrio sp. OR37]|nr:hypothetical protein SAMN04487830_14212 [Pseudobutyrivibrio sp. OR37]
MDKLRISRMVQIITLFLGVLFIPMIMYTSFVYGTIWSVALALWAFVAMGLQDEKHVPGWSNGYNYTTYEESNCITAVQEERAKADIALLTGYDVNIGIGTVIMANAVVSAGTNIGKGCIINTSANRGCRYCSLFRFRF